MEKILAEVSVPPIGKSYDVFLPQSITVSQAVQMLNNIFAGLNEEYFKDSSQIMLCDKDNGVIYNPEDLIRETRITNGSKLLLI